MYFTTNLSAQAGEFENFFSLDVWTMIFAWINIVILFFVLKKLLFKPLKNMIEKRQKEISDLYGDANRSKEEADNLKADYQTKLEKATEESEQMIKDATRRAQLKEEEILQEARDDAAKTLKRAEEQIEMEKKQALNDIKDEVSDMAVSIASAVLEKNIDSKDNADMIDRFIDNLGEQS